MKRSIEYLQKIDSEFLTVNQVAEFMGVSKKTLYKHIDTFPFRVEKIGRRLLIPKRAFIEYVLRSR